MPVAPVSNFALLAACGAARRQIRVADANQVVADANQVVVAAGACSRMQSERPMNDLLRAIRAMPLADRLRRVQRIVEDVAQDAEHAKGATSPPSVIGLFADEPELVDEICEAAMIARERDPLRQPGA